VAGEQGALNVLPWIQALAFIPLIVAVRARRIERRMFERFKDAGANVGERAIFVDHDGLLKRMVFRRLRASAVLRDAGNDRYYWDAAAYSEFRGRRRRRAALAIAAIVLGVLMLFFSGDISL
jgi:hypothetical protein